MSTKADPLECWQQFPLGAVVRLSPRSGGSTAGLQGVVVERLDDRIDGFASYCVEVERDGDDGFPRAERVDCSRCMLSRVYVGRGHQKRAMRRSVKAGDA